MGKHSSQARRVTITDIAAAAGVSISTVSRVLSGSRPVGPELHRKVMEAAGRLSYRPNLAAKAMKGQSMQTIGIIVPDITSPFFASIVAGALHEARKHNQQVIVASSERDISVEESILAQFAELYIDGLVFSPVTAPTPEPEAGFVEGFPTVIAARRSVVAGCPHVYTDNVQGAYTATKYLLKLGRQRVAFLAGFWKPPCTAQEIDEASLQPRAGAFSTLDRFTGYKKALLEEGIPLDLDLVVMSGYDFRAGFEAARELTARLVPVHAILAANDLVAAGALSFLRHQGIRVPEDVSVIGYDDGIAAPLTAPDLTSVHQDDFGIGQRSVVMLDRMIAGEAPDDEVVGTQLVIRGSTIHRTTLGD
ncbi:MAG: LacI family DNA-binding transcriptional regulator [Clostridia bacterium]|nr:LacI family DNA-binding transcriptional regulator [Clostridia bacterium]